ILGNHAGDAGGGIDTDGSDSSKVFINAGRLVGNTSVNQGAAVSLDAIGTDTRSANLTVMRTLVAFNTAFNAPTGALSNAAAGAVRIVASTVEYNFSGGAGGGFGDANNLGTLSVVASLFLGNSAVTDGGGVLEGGPTTFIRVSEFAGNSCGGSGGGV